MKPNPAELAQMDREKALWDDKLNELVDTYLEFKGSDDNAVALFELMSAMTNVPGWKLRATLACAVQRIAEAQEEQQP